MKILNEIVVTTTYNGRTTTVRVPLDHVETTKESTNCMSGKAAREKGKRGERELAKKLQRVFPEAERSYNQSRSGSDDADIANTYPYWFEGGVGNSIRPTDKLKQAEDATKEHAKKRKLCLLRLPIACTKKDRSDWLATLKLDDLLDILECVDEDDLVRLREKKTNEAKR